MPQQTSAYHAAFVNAAKSGWLSKESNRGAFGGWKRRWFILANNCLYYFDITDPRTAKATLPLVSVDVVALDGHRKPFCFEIRTRQGQLLKACKANKHTGAAQLTRHSAYRLQAGSAAEMHDWIAAVRAAAANSIPTDPPQCHTDWITAIRATAAYGCPASADCQPKPQQHDAGLAITATAATRAAPMGVKCNTYTANLDGSMVAKSSAAEVDKVHHALAALAALQQQHMLDDLIEAYSSSLQTGQKADTATLTSANFAAASPERSASSGDNSNSEADTSVYDMPSSVPSAEFNTVHKKPAHNSRSRSSRSSSKLLGGELPLHGVTVTASEVDFSDAHDTCTPAATDTHSYQPPSRFSRVKNRPVHRSQPRVRKARTRPGKEAAHTYTCPPPPQSQTATPPPSSLPSPCQDEDQAPLAQTQSDVGQHVHIDASAPAAGDVKHRLDLFVVLDARPFCLTDESPYHNIKHAVGHQGSAGPACTPTATAKERADCHAHEGVQDSAPTSAVLPVHGVTDTCTDVDAQVDACADAYERPFCLTDESPYHNIKHSSNDPRSCSVPEAAVGTADGQNERTHAASGDDGVEDGVLCTVEHGHEWGAADADADADRDDACAHDAHDGETTTVTTTTVTSTVTARDTATTTTCTTTTTTSKGRGQGTDTSASSKVLVAIAAPPQKPPRGKRRLPLPLVYTSDAVNLSAEGTNVAKVACASVPELLEVEPEPEPVLLHAAGRRPEDSNCSTCAQVEPKEAPDDYSILSGGIMRRASDGDHGCNIYNNDGEAPRPSSYTCTTTDKENNKENNNPKAATSSKTPGNALALFIRSRSLLWANC